MDLVMILILFQKKIKTFGEMRPSVKYKIDHRYQAFKKLKISISFPSLLDKNLTYGLFYYFLYQKFQFSFKRVFLFKQRTCISKIIV